MTETTYKKKVAGTLVFAAFLGVLVFSGLGLAQASHDNGNGKSKGKALGHTYGGGNNGNGGQPETPPPGQVGNENSNRAGTPGNGRGK